MSSSAVPLRAAPPCDAVVLIGGDPLPTQLLEAVARAIDAAPLTVAADGGIAHAHEAGRDLDVLVGDLDSVDSRALDRARAAGTEIVLHPVDKDATDLDLALSLVDARTASPLPHVLLVGGHGGRLDHLLGNLLLIASSRHARLRITGWFGHDVVTVVRDRAELDASDGTVVSLLAVHGPAHGVRTEGLRFPLAGETLGPGSSRGISNELAADRATVEVGGGVLVALQSSPVHPSPEGDHR